MAQKIVRFDEYAGGRKPSAPNGDTIDNIRIEDPLDFLDSEEREEYVRVRHLEELEKEKRLREEEEAASSAARALSKEDQRRIKRDTDDPLEERSARRIRVPYAEMEDEEPEEEEEEDYDSSLMDDFEDFEEESGRDFDDTSVIDIPRSTIPKKESAPKKEAAPKKNASKPVKKSAPKNEPKRAPEARQNSTSAKSAPPKRESAPKKSAAPVREPAPAEDDARGLTIACSILGILIVAVLLFMLWMLFFMRTPKEPEADERELQEAMLDDGALEEEEPEEEEEPVVQQIDNLPEGFVPTNDTVTTTTTLNMRSAPNTNEDNVVTSVAQGSELSRIAVNETTGWSAVLVPGMDEILYCANQYLN